MKNQAFTLIFAVFLFMGCQGQTDNSSVVKVLAPKEFAAKFQSTENAQLIDVRTPQEVQDDRIQDFQNIDWNNANFESKVSKLDKSQPVFVHCRSGGRSSKAAAKLEEMGFTEIYDMDGGMIRWNQDGMPKAK